MLLTLKQIISHVVDIETDQKPCCWHWNKSKAMLLTLKQNKSQVVDIGAKQKPCCWCRNKTRRYCWCPNKTKATLLMEHSKSNTTIICQICQQLVKGLCWRKLEIIWPDTRALPRRSLWFDQTASHSLSYSVSYLYRYRAARAAKKQKNIEKGQRELQTTRNYPWVVRIPKI